MKHTSALPALVFGLVGLAQACKVSDHVKVTFYGYPDNSPPGAATAYNCGGRHNRAGGTGSYADPLTFASAPGEFSACEIIYLPYLQKYLRMEDICGQCEKDRPALHIDVWTGSATHNGGNAQIDCEDSLTRSSADIVRAPPHNLPVKTQPLFDGKCHKDRTFPREKATCK